MMWLIYLVVHSVCGVLAYGRMNAFFYKETMRGECKGYGWWMARRCMFGPVALLSTLIVLPTFKYGFKF